LNHPGGFCFEKQFARPSSLSCPGRRAPFCIQLAPARAQSQSTLAQRIQKVISRPEFAHANFGIEFYSLDTGKVVYALNADKLFVPASTTKILTEGTLLAKLGADYRFHTRVYRTGSIDKHGTLNGDLILVPAAIPIFPIASSPTALSPSSTMTTLTTAPRFQVIPWRHQTTRQGCLRKRDSQDRRPSLRRRHSASRCRSRRRHQRRHVFHHDQRQRHRSSRQTWRQARRSRPTHRFAADRLDRIRQ